MEKKPFQKLRSQVERKKLFQALIEQGVSITVKTGEESLLTLNELRFFHETHVMAQASSEGVVLGSLEEVIGNFQVGDEKYFFKTSAELVGNTLSFPIHCDVYLLQRRGSQRFTVLGKKEVPLRVSEYNGKSFLIHGTLVDISQGGARVLLRSDHSADWKNKIEEVEVGASLKMTISFSESKLLEVQGIIRHQVKEADEKQSFLGEFGVEFQDLTASQKNRLTIVTLDLQKKYFIHQD
jgi:hypothetical protein